MNATSSRSSYSLPLLAIALWAGNTVIAKTSADLIPVSSITFYRWFLAIILLMPFIAGSIWRDRPLEPHTWLKLLVLSFLGMIVFQGLTYEAARTTSAINMGVIMALNPMLTSVLACFVAGEKITSSTIVGGVVSLAGVIFLTSEGNPALVIHNGIHVGDGLLFIAIFSNAIYGVLAKRWSLNLKVSHSLFWQILLALPALFMWCWISKDNTQMNLSNAAIVLYAGLGGSLLAPMLWLMSIKKLGAGKTAGFFNFLPVFVVLFAAAFLGEQVRTFHLIGGGITLAGMLISGFRRLDLSAKQVVKE